MRTRLVSACIICLFLILAGCNMPQKQTLQPTETQPEQITETAIPTEEPTPEPVREKIVFLASDEVPAITENLSSALASLCADAYECRTVTAEDAIDADTSHIIFAKEPTALSSLTERFPGANFIVVTDPQTAYPNAWTIRYDEAFLPFLAGLATAGSARDWRSVGLIPNDSPVWGSHAEEAFLNGAHYLCGNCRSIMAPYVEFPLVISLPGDSSAESWSTRFDELHNSSIIYTAFLSDEAISEALLQKLIGLNVQMLGISAPPVGLENNWLATIRLDWTETLRQIIARADAGEKQGSMGVVLSITPGALRESFSEGKSSVLRNAYTDLLSGRLSPYTPTTTYSE